MDPPHICPKFSKLWTQPCAPVSHEGVCIPPSCLCQGGNFFHLTTWLLGQVFTNDMCVALQRHSNTMVEVARYTYSLQICRSNSPNGKC